MRRDKLRPKYAPDAPHLCCDDCDSTGRVKCSVEDCDGTGRVSVRVRGYTAMEDACTECEGKGDKVCGTCEGEGGYPDPQCALLCPRCDEYIDEDTSACMKGCGYTYAAPAREVA